MSDRVNQIVATLRARYTDTGRLEVMPQEVPPTAAEQVVIAPADLMWLVSEHKRMREALEVIGRERNTWAKQLADSANEVLDLTRTLETERTERVRAEAQRDNMQILCQMLAEDWMAVYKRWKDVMPNVAVFRSHATRLLKIVGDDD